MNFSLTEDQRMLVDAAQAFCRKQSPIARARKLRDDPRGYSAEVWRQLGELGWLGLIVPEAAGGLGGRFVDLALVLEQLGATLVPEPVASTTAAIAAVVAAGDLAQQQAHLAPVLAGQHTLALRDLRRYLELAGPLSAELRAHIDGKLAEQAAQLVSPGQTSYTFNTAAKDFRRATMTLTWTVEADPGAPSAPNVLMQSGAGDFPWCVRKGTASSLSVTPMWIP